MTSVGGTQREDQLLQPHTDTSLFQIATYIFLECDVIYQHMCKVCSNQTQAVHVHYLRYLCSFQARSTQSPLFWFETCTKELLRLTSHYATDSNYIFVPTSQPSLHTPAPPLPSPSFPTLVSSPLWFCEINVFGFHIKARGCFSLIFFFNHV